MAQVFGDPPYYTLLGRASSDILKAGTSLLGGLLSRVPRPECA